ncbi:MAG: TRAP transporter large permease [Hyphomicrobiales bacterium]
MELVTCGVVGILALLLVLFCLGMPVGLSMAAVGFCGFTWVVSIPAAVNMVGADIWVTFSKYGFTVIPLFILMGYLAFNAGIAERLFDSAYKWMGHWPGGLAIAAIGADELFAAICGSNTATSATMGAVALPQMKKYNYDPRLSSGTIATGGTLGTVMPPSVVMVIIGLQTEQSIAKLFLGGILPALLLGGLFILTIVVLCRIHPHYGPAGPRFSRQERMKSLGGIMEALVIFVLVIGGLYVGIFTPTEAGAVGVFFTAIVALVMRRLDWKGVLRSFRETLKISCMVYMLVAGAIIFGRFLAVTRLPFHVAEFAAGLPVSPYVVLVIIILIYLIGGCFMDSLGFLVLTIPIFFPLGERLGFDPIWYSIMLTMVTTMGAITPPVGVNVYVVKALAPEISIATIYQSVTYYLTACLVSLVLLTIFPGLATFIPSLVK